MVLRPEDAIRRSRMHPRARPAKDRRARISENMASPRSDSPGVAVHQEAANRNYETGDGKSRAPKEPSSRLTSPYIFLARRTLVTRLLVPSAPKTSSVLDSLHRRCTRLHSVMASCAGGAGLFRGGTTLWLIRFLLFFASTLPTGVLVPKITNLGEA